MLKIMEKSPNLLRKKIVLILTMSSQVPHTALTCSFAGSSHVSETADLAPSPHNPNEKWL